MTSAKTAKTARPTTLSPDETEQPLAVTLRPFIIGALPRLRRIGALPDAALLDPRSPLAPLGRNYRDPSWYRMLARACTHLVREDTKWQRASVLARNTLILEFLQVAGLLFEIIDARDAL